MRANRLKSSAIDRLRQTCLALPGAWEKISHGEPTFWVGQRMFATFADAATHHGNGRDAVWCKSTHTTQDLLIARDPDRYFRPPYVGPTGWIGMHLDRRVSWREVGDRLKYAHELAAPPRAGTRAASPARVKRRRP